MNHKQLDAQELKEIYNQNFSQTNDLWSTTNLSYTVKIAKKILRVIKKRNPEKLQIGNVLDVGCAKGYFTEAFRLNKCKAFGLDYSDIAIQIAEKKFPECTFLCIDGFNPVLNQKFDIIFIRGFSGCNTRDFEFVAGFCNKYIEYLNPNGWLILAFPTNFSGTEKENKTVNWSINDIEILSKLIHANWLFTKYFEDTTYKKIAFSIKNLYKKTKSQSTFFKKAAFFFKNFYKKDKSNIKYPYLFYQKTK